MKLHISSPKFTADKSLLDFVQKRADKLDQFFDHIIGAEVILRLENDATKENKVFEVTLSVPGHLFFAKERKGTFEAAGDEAFESLRRQLRRYKGKLIDSKKAA